MNIRQAVVQLTVACLMLGIALAPPGAADAVSESPFLFVVDDDGGLEQSGLADHRTLYARAVRTAADKGAHAVALKFFFTDSRPAIDAGLTAAFGDVPVYLQFALVGQAAANAPERLPQGSFFPAQDAGDRAYHAARDSEFPNAALQAAAAGLGFVDVIEPFDKNQIGMVGSYPTGTAKSMVLTLLETQFGPSELKDGSLISNGKTLALDKQGRVACDIETVPALNTTPLRDFAGIDPARVTGKTVVIGYVGERAPRLSTGWFSSMSVHELFFARLSCLADLIGQPG